MTLTPHSIIHGDACFAYFNKIWGIPDSQFDGVVGPITTYEVTGQQAIEMRFVAGRRRS